MAEGESFRAGEVWESPRGLLYRVVSVEPISGRRPRAAVLRRGIDGAGRSLKRDWDAVAGWRLHQQATAKFTLTSPQMDRLDPLMRLLSTGGAVLAQIDGRSVTACCVTPAQAAAIKRILDGADTTGEQQP